MTKKFTAFAFAAAALMAVATAQAGTAAAAAPAKTEAVKPVATAAATPALGEKATSIFCAKAGHEDGYPTAVANEIRDAIKAEEVKGGTTAQAIDRIYVSKCGPNFAKKG